MRRAGRSTQHHATAPGSSSHRQRRPGPTPARAPGGSRRHDRPPEHRCATGRPCAVLPARPRLPAVGRERPRSRRLHVCLGPQPAGLATSAGAGRAGRLPERPDAALRRAGRGAGRHHRPCRRSIRTAPMPPRWRLWCHARPPAGARCWWPPERSRHKPAGAGAKSVSKLVRSTNYRPGRLPWRLRVGHKRIEMFQYRQVLVRLRTGDTVREMARSGLKGRGIGFSNAIERPKNGPEKVPGRARRGPKYASPGGFSAQSGRLAGSGLASWQVFERSRRAGLARSQG